VCGCLVAAGGSSSGHIRGSAGGEVLSRKGSAWRVRTGLGREKLDLGVEWCAIDALIGQQHCRIGV